MRRSNREYIWILDMTVEGGRRRKLLTFLTVMVLTPVNLEYFSSMTSSCKWTGNWVRGFTAISFKAPSLLKIMILNTGPGNDLMVADAFR